MVYNPLFWLGVITLLLALRIARRQAVDLKIIRDELREIRKYAEMTEAEKVDFISGSIRSKVNSINVVSPKTFRGNVQIKVKRLWHWLIYFPDEVPDVIMKPVNQKNRSK